MDRFFVMYNCPKCVYAYVSHDKLFCRRCGDMCIDVLGCKGFTKQAEIKPVDTKYKESDCDEHR